MNYETLGEVLNTTCAGVGDQQQEAEDDKEVDFIVSFMIPKREDENWNEIDQAEYREHKGQPQSDE